MLCCHPTSAQQARIVEDVLLGTRLALTDSQLLLSASPIPGLDGAVTILSALLDKVMKMRENNDTRDEIAREVEKLLFAMKSVVAQADNSVDSADPDDRSKIRTVLQSSPDLARRVQGLTTELEDLDKKAVSIAQGSAFSRWLRSDENAAILRDIKTGINQALKRFETQSVAAIEQLLTTLVRETREKKEKETLSNLPYRETADYRSKIHAVKNAFLPGTRDDLLSELEAWAKDASAQPSFFILSGIAGTGKSTIAYELARRLDAEKRLGASFFFVRGDADLSSMDYVIPTIAYQLAYSQPAFYAPVIEGTRHHLMRGRQQDMDFQVNDLCIEPLSQVQSNHAPVVIILDALDECTDLAQEHIPRLLYLLLRGVRRLPFPLRIMLTSRPELHIENVFTSADFLDASKPFRLHDVPRTDVDHDIELLYSEGFKTIPSANALLELRPNILTELTTVSEGLFIHAATVMRILRQDPYQILALTDTLLSNGAIAGDIRIGELDRLYLVVLKQAFPSDFLDRRATNRSLMQAVLGVIALLRDHVSPSTMRHLLDVSILEIWSIISRLGSVLYTGQDTDPIRPLHASFPQFLIDGKRCTDHEFYVDPNIRHGSIANACLRLPDSHNLRRNILQLSDPTVEKSSVEDLERRLQTYIPAHIQYACSYWATHLLEAPHTPELFNMVKTFSERYMLLWLEAMSALDKLDVAIRALLNVRSWLQVQEDVDTLGLFADAYRLALEYYPAIDACPEQIYISGLSQMPSCRLFRMYGHEASVHLLSPRDLDWNACLHVAEGHTGTATAVKASSSGRWYISASLDGTLRKWDAESGAILNIMRGHNDEIQSVDISPDNQFVASVSVLGEIFVWNTATGALIRKLSCVDDAERLRDPALSTFSSAVAVSPDSAFIVTSVTVWIQASYPDSPSDLHDRSSSILMKSQLDCESLSHDKRSTPITSSTVSHCAQVDSASSYNVSAKTSDRSSELSSMSSITASPMSYIDKNDYRSILSIWDVASGTCLQSVETAQIRSIVFSSDGTAIMAGLSEGTICRHNASDLAVTGVLTDDNLRGVNSIALSPDGGTIVSGSVDSSVRIWDVCTMVCTNRLEGHSGAVVSVDISPKGTLIASAANDKSVHLWDLHSGNCVAKLSPMSVHSIAFTCSGEELLSASSSTDVRLWDVQAIIDGNITSDMASLQSFFFHDQHGLVVWSTGAGEITAWDLRKQEYKYTSFCADHIEQPTSDSWDLHVHLPDRSQLIVAQSANNAMFIWHLLHGELRATLTWDNTTSISSIAYSPSGKFIAASGDSAVSLWAAEDGTFLSELPHRRSEDPELDMPIWELTFSSDSAMLLARTLNDTGNVVWRCNTGEILNIQPGGDFYRRKELGRFDYCDGWIIPGETHVASQECQYRSWFDARGGVSHATLVNTQLKLIANERKLCWLPITTRPSRAPQSCGKILLASSKLHKLTILDLSALKLCDVEQHVNEETCAECGELWRSEVRKISTKKRSRYTPDDSGSTFETETMVLPRKPREDNFRDQTSRVFGICGGWQQAGYFPDTRWYKQLEELASL
ncbi:WD40 repeat-like protein [Wolfiporia cocos MD-104 SS10]|uniref:WD40 repeat-like protein n=1 Tax=Wolfiporia cocos (strain MD-104) TaxID=742152 RepID=A0A2H3JM79_WOLCO|nr:WD40 repeat-like protein [Wolfiporia cocos MD-104 SS10]